MSEGDDEPIWQAIDVLSSRLEEIQTAITEITDRLQALETQPQQDVTKKPKKAPVDFLYFKRGRLTSQLTMMRRLSRGRFSTGGFLRIIGVSGIYGAIISIVVSFFMEQWDRMNRELARVKERQEELEEERKIIAKLEPLYKAALKETLEEHDRRVKESLLSGTPS